VCFLTVGIIGGRGTGKTIFVSLLATTAINYAVETKEHFRYYTYPEFTTIVHDIVGSLKLRKWPPATLKGSLTEYRFWFGYSRLFSGILNKFYDNIENLVGLIKRLEIPRRELYNIIEFGVYDVSGEDVDIIFRAAALAKERGLSVLEMIPENLKAILECDVLVFLIDSSKITTDNSDPRYKEMLDYDGLMASLMSLVALYRSSKYGVKAGKLFPVFVFTKFDTVDKKVLRALGIPDNFERWFLEKSRDRTEINERLREFMKKFYQHTLAIIEGTTLIGVELGRAQMFVSYLMTDLSEEGISVPRVVRAPDGVSYELVYSRSEYIRFIDYFGKIANEIKKAHKLPEGVAPVTGVGR
jgi:hypothetical protein